MTQPDTEEQARAAAKVEANLLTALASIRQHWRPGLVIPKRPSLVLTISPATPERQQP